MGKTVSCKQIIVELEDQTDDIVPIYVNCWQRNTTFKILYYICEKLEFKFIQNKTEELFSIVKQSLNKKSVVFILDEVDKLEEPDFIYMILEEIYRKTIILITNYKEWLINLDERIKSRLMPEIIEYKPYNQEKQKEF